MKNNISSSELYYKLVLLSCAGGEWISNLVFFWVRPIYRIIIKTKIGKQIVFKIGNRINAGHLMFWSCLVTYSVISFGSIGVCEILLILGFEQLCKFLVYVVGGCSLAAACLALFFCNGVQGGLSGLYAIGWPVDLVNSRIRFDNPEEFFQYHDGHFKKDKLIHRIANSIWKGEEH